MFPHPLIALHDRQVRRHNRQLGSPRTDPARRPEGKILSGLGRGSVAAVALLVVTSAAASFAESYRGLYLWASHHDLTGLWSVIWPLQIDSFIAVGEFALVAALVYRWSRTVRAGWWAVTLGGLAASVAGNVGHITGHDLASRATAAVPPLAAAAALAVGLGILKRLADREQVTETPDAQTLKTSDPQNPRTVTADLALDPAALAAAPSAAARTRLASAALGTTSPAAVRAALADAGHPVALEAARSALRRVRADQQDATVVQMTPASRDLVNAS